MDVKDGAGKRRPHHAGLEVSWREADVDADAEQDRHAAVEDAFDSSIDRSVRGLLAGCRRKDGVCCHVILRLQDWVLRGPPEMDLPGWVEDITQWAFHKGVFRREVSQLPAPFAPLSSEWRAIGKLPTTQLPGSSQHRAKM